MSWSETLSPGIPRYLDAWANLRGRKKVPSLDALPEFMKLVSPEFTAVVDLSDKRERKFLDSGKNVTALYPGCGNGSRFTDLTPITLRPTVSRPIS